MRSAFGGGNYGVWRVDTLTGDVQICTLTPSDLTPDKQNNPSEKTLDPDENNPFAKLATPGDVPPAKTFFAVPCRSAVGWEPAGRSRYVQHYCAKCHAIADEGASPDQTAPSFKDVANSSGMTATALTVWLQTSHPTMPNIILAPSDRDNVVAYILSLKD